MARCGCASDRCSCYIVEGENVSVTGAGTQANPFVVSAATTVIDDSGNPGPTSQFLTGMIIEYGGITAPVGWLICDGAAVSRNVYAALFAVLGTTRGAGDGSTTFNLPNKNDRFTIGASGSRPRGTKGGAETHTLTTAAMPAHSHGMNHDHGRTGSGGTHDHQLQRSASPAGDGTTTNIPVGGAVTTATSGAAIQDDGAHDHNVPSYSGSTTTLGSGAAVNHMPPFEASIFLIKT